MPERWVKPLHYSVSCAWHAGPGLGERDAEKCWEFFSERDSLALSCTFKLPVFAAYSSASQSVGGLTGSFMKCAVFFGVAQVLLVSKASGSVFKTSAAGMPLEAAVQGSEILIVHFTCVLEIPDTNSCQAFWALKNYMPFVSTDQTSVFRKA